LSASTLLKPTVEAYNAAQQQLGAFHAAINQHKTKVAAEALHNAAQAICYGLSQAVEDQKFWAEAADLLNKANTMPNAMKTVLENLEKVAEEEANILRAGGYTAESVSALLGDFEITLGAFKEYPSGNTLQLAQERVRRSQKIICELASRGVEIESDHFWGRAYRSVRSTLKSFSGVGTIVCDVATAGVAAAASAGVLTPLALGVAAVSVTGGVVTIMGVGEEIYGGLIIRRT